MGNHSTLKPLPEQEQLLAVIASPLKLLVFGLLLITAVVGTLGVYQQLHSRSQALHHAENSSTDLANIFQQSIGAMLHGAGGNIEIDSSAGMGTTVTIMLSLNDGSV